MFAHVITSKIPDRKQNTLALVVAGAISVGLTKITKSDGAIYGGNHLGESNL
jgi:hypothetical protein